MACRKRSAPGRKHWLCVAYAFPPINRSGTHRTLGFVRHLDRLGWEAAVLTVEPGDEPTDKSLCSGIPSSTTIIRTAWTNMIEQAKKIGDGGWEIRGSTRQGAPGKRKMATDNGRSAIRDCRSYGLRNWLSRLLLTPDSRIGWIGPAVRAGMRAIRRRRPDVIYSTSPYMSAHLIAFILSRWTRLPWVADFRDPWRGNPFRRIGSLTLDGLDSFLEWLVLRAATHIVCCTPTMTEALYMRRPFVGGKCSTILNGIDTHSFADVRPLRPAPAEHFVLTHCGQFYGPRSPRVWFSAVRRALDRAPDRRGSIHVVLIGPQKYDGRLLSDWASEAGIGECVHAIGERSHVDALRYMAGSDALMLAGSSGNGTELQVPNKLFEYLAMRKPIIAACSATGPIVEVVNEARAEALICDPTNERALADAILQLSSRRRVNVKDAWTGVGRFDRARRAEELVSIFRRVSANYEHHNKASNRTEPRRLRKSSRTSCKTTISLDGPGMPWTLC